MREANETVRGFDHVSLARLIERVGRDTDGAKERDRQAAIGSDEKERLSRRSVKGVKPRSHEPLQAGRDSQWEGGVARRIRRLGTGELERIERVTARHLMEPPQD